MKMKRYPGILVLILLLTSAKSDVTNIFTLKNFEKTLSKVDENLYASKYEVTNLQYTSFLKYLKTNHKTKEFEIAKIDSLGWINNAKYKLPYAQIYHINNAYKNYPVVNISYEGAKMFCQWLTEKYNNYPKRKFKKVIFRLPTEKEWEKVAKGGLKDAVYSWGGYYLTDLKGKYQANFNTIGATSIHYDKEKQKYVVLKDGSGEIIGDNEITVPVDMYQPNNFGLYNVCGNVKEMISEKGKVKGGGWHSPGYDIRIDVFDTYTKPANDIGFRYFVEIIERY